MVLLAGLCVRARVVGLRDRCEVVVDGADESLMGIHPGSQAW